jgi:DNA-binding MarR family transcriptional regulator
MDLAEHGFDDLHPAHLNVFQHPPPRGARPSDLARASGMTKQAMNHLLGQLTELGYLERRPPAGGGTGTTVWLTDRGEDAVRVMRRAVEATEAEWGEALGKRRFATLRELLVELNERL